MIRICISILTVFFILTSCSEDSVPLFVDRAASSGIEFSNDLTYTADFNPYTYRNFYNGGGVALGDINNDGWIDIYLTGNQVDNKLYLNNGGWLFEDISEVAGVNCPQVWSTGAVMVDVNGDNLLDIYVCKAGKPGGSNRHNELFINQGDLTFVDESEKYGLNVVGLSIQSSFLDFDKDGDLDCYLLSNSIRPVNKFELEKDLRQTPDEHGNKFFENRNGVYVDVTESVGIYSSSIGYGLGVAVSDFNNDGWQDIFIANDFFERDYLYLNNQKGKFEERGLDFFTSMTLGSMGCDAADVNNDGSVDLFVAEMLPASLERQKTKTIYDNWDKYQRAIKAGYHHQYPRNALHINQESLGFEEISRLTNLMSTEWSWSSLICDLNNDGLKDIYVCNGIGKDLLDRDYLTYSANATVQSKLAQRDIGPIDLVNVMPSSPVSNAVFQNNGDLNFENRTTDWGFDATTFSNGGAYADLDNDGDLDLVINNTSSPAQVFENKTDTSASRSINIELEGGALNTSAIGAKVQLKWNNGEKQIAEQSTTRGFQSAVSDRIHFGAGNGEYVDTVRVIWPDGLVSEYFNLETNKLHTLNFNEANSNQITQSITNRKEGNSFNIIKDELEFFHRENIFNEFNRERLLTQMNSNEGPKLATTDVNDDGVNDLFVGGGKDQSSVLFLSDESGSYKALSEPWEVHRGSEVTEVIFFDSDGDGDQDLYVGHGGRIFSIYSPLLNDQLYLNNGEGQFTIADAAFSFPKPISTGAVAVGDYNSDGLQDVFVGERYRNDFYGIPGSGFLFRNTGSNKFVLDEENSSHFRDIGMITDAEWTILYENEGLQLVVAGDWMPVSIYGFNSGRVAIEHIEDSKGLWHYLNCADVDGDGDLDLILGNVGENAHYSSGMRMTINDFDRNGSVEQILTVPAEGSHWPIHDKDNIISQLPGLRKKFETYSDYSKMSLDELIEDSLLNNSIVLDLEEVRSLILLNAQDGWTKFILPQELQYSSIYTMLFEDVDGDNIKDLIAGGNQYLVQPQFGPQQASKGWVILGFENNLNSNDVKVSPLGVEGQVRDLVLLNNRVVFGMNGDSLQIIDFNEDDF